jgi:hypothetical protein
MLLVYETIFVLARFRLLAYCDFAITIDIRPVSDALRSNHFPPFPVELHGLRFDFQFHNAQVTMQTTTASRLEHHPTPGALSCSA